MKTKYLLVVLIIFIVSCSQSLKYKSVKNNKECTEKKGYWYKEQCWKEFEDQGISEANIDQVVFEQIKAIEETKIIFDNKNYSLSLFSINEDDDETIVLIVFHLENNYKTLIFSIGDVGEEDHLNDIEFPVLLFDKNLAEVEEDTANINTPLNGTAKVSIPNDDDLVVKIVGSIMDQGEVKEFIFTGNQEAISGAGNSVLEVKEGMAYLSGDLGTITYLQIKNLIKDHPEIKTIVLGNISGSVNDAITMHTGRLVHENGFTTMVLSDSNIASGGVDFFSAGEKRIVEKGAKIGVHSWCCIDNLAVTDLPEDHPAHKYQLEYFSRTLGPENGPAFYFYTLEAAPFNEIYYMTDEEIKSWKLATEFIE